MALFSLSLDSRGPSRPTVRLPAVDPFTHRPFFFFFFLPVVCVVCVWSMCLKVHRGGAGGHYGCKDGPKRGQNRDNSSRDVTDVTNS